MARRYRGTQLECPNCHYELAGSESVCPECGLVREQMRSTEQRLRLNRRWKVDCAVVSTVVTASASATALGHANEISDQAFLALLVIVGMCPVWIWSIRSRAHLTERSREQSYILLMGGFFAVLLSFWVPPRIAYWPMGGVVLAFFLMLVAGPILLAVERVSRILDKL